MPPETWDDAAAAYLERKRNGAALNTIQDRNPEEAARARRIAKYVGVAPALAEGNALIAKDVQLQQNRETIAQYPWMARWLGDPDQAALVGKDDLPKVGRIADRVARRPTVDPSLTQSSFFGKDFGSEIIDRPRNPLPLIDAPDQPRSTRYEGPRVIPPATSTGDTRVDVLRGWFSASVGGLTSAVAGGAGALQNLAGLEADDPRRARISEIAEAGDFLRQYYRPVTGDGAAGVAGEYVFDAGQMVFDMAVGGGIAGKALAGYFGATTFGSAYAKYNERSDDKGEALLGAGIEGSAEYLFERGPVASLVKAFGGDAAKGLILDYLRKEVIGEVLTAGVQYSAETNLADPTEEFTVIGLGKSMLDAAVVSVLGGAAIGTLAGTMRPAARAAREAQALQEGIIGQAVLDEAIEQGKKAEMRDIAPGEFAAFVQEGVADTPYRNVYVPIEAVDAVLQSETVTEEERAVLSLYQEQFEEARARGGDVVVPVGEFVARFEPLYQSLRDEVRMTPGGLSAKEAREGREKILAELDKVAAETETTDQRDADRSSGAVTTPRADRTSKQQVFDLVKQQMLDAGRTAQEAETTALLAASRAENLASERYGQFADAMAAWKAEGFTIRKGGSGKRAGPKAKRTVNREQQQAVEPTEDVFSSTTGDGTVDPERSAYQSSAFKEWFGDSKVVDANGAPLVVYHGTAENFEAFSGNNFFSDDPAVAQRFREGISASYDDGRTGRVVSAYIRIERPVVIDAKGDFAANVQFGKARKAWEAALADSDADGIIIRNTKDEGTIYIPRQSEQIKSTANVGTFDPADPRILFQGARGKTDWFADGSTVVTLFAEADFSTMLHEMSHVFLEQEFKLAKAEGASAQLKADVETVAKWFAANGHPVGADGVIPDEAHEMFARSGERYFREGKAPSAELRGAFATFRKWLTDIYKSLKALNAYGKAPLNHDIRSVMDRIVATGEAIEDNAIAPMSQADLDMTDAEYAGYLDAVKATQAEAEDKLLNKAMAAIRARETGRIAEQRRNLKAKFSEQFNEEPGIRALHLLRTGRWLGEPDREGVEVKLHTGWLIDNYGEEILDQLPRGLPITRGDGVVGDVVAELTGMPSGDALVKALVSLRAQADALRLSGDKRSLREAYVDRAVDEAMAQRHGDVGMDEASIREEAIAALNSERQGERLATELRALKRREGKGGVVTPYQILKEWARKQIGEGRVSEVASKAALQRYIRAHNKARTAFEEAILKGDEAEAVRQKQAQMINHALLAEGKRMADELEVVVKRMKRYAKADAQASIEQGYMDRIHELLAPYGFRPPAQFPPETEFEDWAAERTAEGYRILVPAGFREGRTEWKNASVAKVLELNNMVVNLREMGRAFQSVLDGEEQRALNETVDEVEASILALPERSVPEASLGGSNRPFNQAVREAKGVADVGRAILNSIFSESRMGTARKWASDLIHFERMADLIDGTKLGTGAMNRLFIHRATNAQNLVSKLQDEVVGSILEALKGSDGKFRARLNDHITLPFRLNVGLHPDDPRVGQPTLTVSRRQYYGMLANTGNLSNLAKMAAGEKWVEDHESMAELTAFRDQLVSFASVEDLRIINAIWAAVEKLWPHIVRVEKAMTGVVPEKVVAMPYTAKGVEMTGGYWPVVWDSSRSDLGKRQAEDMDSEKTKLFGIATDVGHTITRTGAVGPMEYSIDLVLGGHVTKVISRIAYAEYVRDALRILNNKRVSGAIRLRFGDEYHQQALKWLKDQIPSNSVTVQGAKAMDTFLNWVRVNMSFAVLGLSSTTMMAQSLGLTYAAAQIGEGNAKEGGKWISIGMGLMLKHMGTADGGVADHARAAQDFVFARSEEMAHRMHEVSQEAAEAYRKLKEHDNLYRRAQTAVFVPIAMTDMHVVSIPTWLGAYAKGIHNGLTEEEAARYGDKMVRTSQGSGRQYTMNQLQRGTAGQKFMAMFFTPGAVMFSQQWESLHQWKAGNKAKAVTPLFWMIVVSSLAGALMQGDWPDEGDDEERDLSDWAMWAIRNSLYEFAFGYPIARDAANTAERKQRGEYSEYGSTPYSFGIQTMEGAAKAASDIATREEGEAAVQGKEVKKLSIALGVLGRFPGLQVGRTAGFLTDVYNDEAEPETARDWLSGLAFGKLPEKEEAE